MAPAGFVYLMFCESTGLHKIGFSEDPFRRAATLGLDDGAVVHAIPHACPRIVEKALHCHFAAQREQGEWFALSPDDVATFCAVGQDGYWPPWLLRQIEEASMTPLQRRAEHSRRVDGGDTGFGARLKALREASGMTQAELAAAAGVALGTVRKLEQGIQNPSWVAALALADAMGVRTNDFRPLDEFRPRPVE